MKTKLMLVICAVLSLFILSGCGKDAVQADLLNYLNKEIPQVSDLENQAIDTFSSVSGDNYKDDESLYNALKETVIPKYSELITKMEAIKPETKELSDIHAIYVKAAKTQFDAFNIIVTAVEKQDTGLVQDANNKLDEAKKGITDFQDKLHQLAKAHNVEIKEQ